jgi:arylsulfatase A
VQDIIGSVRTQRWRAVKGRRGWQLYDMISDPGQKKNVAGDRVAVMAELRLAFETMAKDVTKNGFDPIPTHVGYRHWPTVTLPAHEAMLEPAPKQGISYRGASGWANDWITNWTDEDACAWWPIQVVEDGRFEVTVLYVCAQENLGAKLRVEIGGAGAEDAIAQVHDPAPVPSPDRVPRGEVYEKVWAQLTLGAVNLQSGRTRLVLRAVDIPGPQACDVKAIRLRRIV